MCRAGEEAYSRPAMWRVGPRLRSQREEEQAQPEELGATRAKSEAGDAEGRITERRGPRQEDAFRRPNPHEAQEIIGTTCGVLGIRGVSRLRWLCSDSRTRGAEATAATQHGEHRRRERDVTGPDGSEPLEPKCDRPQRATHSTSLRRQGSTEQLAASSPAHSASAQRCSDARLAVGASRQPEGQRHQLHRRQVDLRQVVEVIRTEAVDQPCEDGPSPVCRELVCEQCHRPTR